MKKLPFIHEYIYKKYKKMFCSYRYEFSEKKKIKRTVPGPRPQVIGKSKETI